MSDSIFSFSMEISVILKLGFTAMTSIKLVYLCAVLICSVMSDSLQPQGLYPTQDSLSNGFSRQEYWSGLPFPSPGDLYNSGIEPRSPKLQANSLLPEPPGKSHQT